MKTVEEGLLAREGGLGMTHLLEAFEAGAIHPQEFHHEQHVQVVWEYLQRYSVVEVLERFPAALQRFAHSLGKERLYHATITWAFVLLINERQQRGPAANWADFAAQNSDLLHWKPSILERYYRRETLASELARTTFLMPDAIQGEATADERR